MILATMLTAKHWKSLLYVTNILVNSIHIRDVVIGLKPLDVTVLGVRSCRTSKQAPEVVPDAG